MLADQIYYTWKVLKVLGWMFLVAGVFVAPVPFISVIIIKIALNLIHQDDEVYRYKPSKDDF